MREQLVDEILTSVAKGAVDPGTLQMMRILRVFRCLRALRALRFLRNNVTLRIVMSTLVNAAAPTGVSLCLAGLLVAIVSNLGQSLFSPELPGTKPLPACRDGPQRLGLRPASSPAGQTPVTWARHRSRLGLAGRQQRLAVAAHRRCAAVDRTGPVRGDR